MSQDREEALLALALEKPPSEREAFLEGVCFDDPDLRQRIEYHQDCGSRLTRTQRSGTRPRFLGSGFDYEYECT